MDLLAGTDTVLVAVDLVKVLQEQHLVVKVDQD
jgi:hypothetical protein